MKKIKEIYLSFWDSYRYILNFAARNESMQWENIDPFALEQIISISDYQKTWKAFYSMRLVLFIGIFLLGNCMNNTGARKSMTQSLSQRKNTKTSETYLCMPQKFWIPQSFSMCVKGSCYCVVQERKTFSNCSVLWPFSLNKKWNTSADTTKKGLLHEHIESFVLRTQKLHLLKIPYSTGFKTLKSIGGSKMYRNLQSLSIVWPKKVSNYFIQYRRKSLRREEQGFRILRNSIYDMLREWLHMFSYKLHFAQHHEDYD